MNYKTIEELEAEITLLDTAVHMIGISDIETLLLEYAQTKIDYQNLQVQTKLGPNIFISLIKIVRILTHPRRMTIVRYQYRPGIQQNRKQMNCP